MTIAEFAFQMGATAIPVAAAGWALATKISRLEASMEHLQGDVARAINTASQAHEEVSNLRERVAILESRCSVHHPVMPG